MDYPPPLATLGADGVPDLAATWKAPREAGVRSEVGRAVDSVALHDLIALSRNEAAAVQVRAIATLKLEELRSWLAVAGPKAKDSSERAHLAFAERQIAALERDPRRAEPVPPAEPPDGPPIGADEE